MLVKLLLLFFAFSIFFRTDFSFDQDLGRHIKNGEVALQNFSIPKVNLYSYTNPDFQFVNTHWGFGVIAYLFYSVNALQLLLMLKVAILLISLWIILSIPKPSLLLLPIGFIFLHVLRERTELRPEIFSFLFTALTYWILEKFTVRTSTRTIYFLPVIQLLWVNIHIYFFVGLVLQVIYLFQIGWTHLRSNPGGWRLKQLAIIFSLSLLMSILNPNGINGLLYPLYVNQNYGYTIVENQNIFFLEQLGFANRNFLFAKLAAVIIFISIIYSLFKKSFNLKNSLIALFGLILAFLHVRSLPFLVFLSLPAVMVNFSSIKVFWWNKGLTYIAGTLLVLEAFFYLNGWYYKSTDSQYQPRLEIVQSGKGALDFFIQNDLNGPIYNNFDIGGYTIFKLFPKERVFVDNRPEAFPAEFFQTVYIPTQYDFQKFKVLDKQYQFKTIIFSHTDQTPWAKAFLSNVIKDPDWKTVYIDDFMIVLVKSNSTLQAVDLSKLHPNQYNFENHLSDLKLGIFLLNNNFPNGSEFLQTAYKKNPGSSSLNSMQGRVRNNFWW